MAETAPWDWSWADYLYPDTHVLRNKLNIRDPERAAGIERQLSAGRQIQLEENPQLLQRSFDLAHWQGIHAHLFGDFYDWAGQFRTVEMGIPLGPDLPTVTFAPSDELPARSSDLMAWIRDEHMFADRPRHGFVAGLTIALATANKLHPFREGNGRVQRILAEHIAQHAGYRLDWSEIPAYAQDAAQFAAYHDQPEYLAGILDSALTEIPRTTSPWRLPGTGTDVLAAARTSTHSPATAPASAPLHATQLGYGD